MGFFDLGKPEFVSGVETGTNSDFRVPTATTEGGSFDEWLAGLPSGRRLAPMNQSMRNTGMGPNLVPYLWMQFAPYAREQIALGAEEEIGGITTGLASGRQEYERSLLSAYGEAGVDQLFAKSAIAETAPRLGEQIAAARGGVRAREYEDVLNLMGGINNALAQAFQSERELGIQAHFADLARQDAMSVAKMQGELARQQAGNSILNPFAGGGGGGAVSSLF